MKKPKIIAYLRVSTAEQDFEKVIFLQEKISGTIPWKKRKIAVIIDELGKGDNLTQFAANLAEKYYGSAFDFFKFCFLYIHTP